MTVHSAKDDRSLSYVAALSDRLWLLMIDVNAVTQPGSVPSETLAWIADQLEQAKRSGCRSSPSVIRICSITAA